MSGHHPDIRPVPVPDWVLYRPVCSCGWTGDIVRTRPFAEDQVDEHLAASAPQTRVEQPALPGL